VAEPPATEPLERSGNGPAPRSWLTRNIVVLSAVSFLQDTASELLYPILPTFVTVVLGAPAAVLGSIEGLADGISAIVSPFAGRAADRMGRKPLITAGYGLAAFVSVKKTVRHNRDRILAAVEIGLWTSKLEGLNSKIRLINYRGYGHRSPLRSTP